MPRWLRDRMRHAVRDHARSLVYLAIDPAVPRADARLSGAFESQIAHLAAVDGKHLPIEPGADSYIVPMVGRSDPASPDGMPIPPENLWWDYADTAERYLEIGRLNIGKMRSILSAAGRDLRPGDRILDFGCAAGPQIRCLKEFAENGQVWGADLSAPHVTWCMSHLPECFRFAVTTGLPHLPFEDRYFDLAYCGSVFSHMSEMTDAWLLELSRVIRPGGHLYLSMNSKQSMHHYLKWWPKVEFSRAVRRAFIDEKPWESNFAVAVVGRSVWQHSVYNLSFFQRKCEQANFRVVSTNRNAYSFQTVLLLERLETRRETDKGDVSAVRVVNRRDSVRAS